MKKEFQAGDQVYVHENPVWRDKANYIIRVYLEDVDGRSQWEQLWVKKIDERKYIICCIPFFAFDLALGDEVETDENSVVQKVTKPSNSHCFRVWFGNAKSINTKDMIVKELEGMCSFIEWSSENFLAVSVEENSAKKVADYLYFNENEERLNYETARSAHES